MSDEKLPPGLELRAGIYHVRAMVDGVRRRKSTKRSDLKSAIRRYHEIMKAWHDGAVGWGPGRVVPTLRQFWEKDYRPVYTLQKTPTRPNPHKKGEFIYRDDSLIEQALQDLGDKRLTDFNPTMCAKWAMRRRRMTYVRREGGTRYPIQEGTVTREIAFLQSLFGKAKDDGLIEKNPWETVSREADKIRVQVVSPEDQAKLETVLPPRYRRWLLFMIGTGLRLEECRGIDETKDVSFPQRFVRVTRKTRGLRKNIQDVPLIDEFLLDLLQEQLTEDNELWHQSQASFREMLRLKSQKAGIEHVSPHTLRHTFATRFLKGGGDIYILSKILGHASVKITEKVYAHLLSVDLLTRAKHINLGLTASAAGKLLSFPPTAGGRQEEAS